MENLNDVLKDKSSNDKLLVKELSKIIKYNKDNNKKIDNNFIKKVIETVQDSDPDLALRSIEFDNEECSCYGQYGEKNLFIYTGEINKAYNSKRYKLFKKIKDKRLLAYNMIVHSVVHELTHCKQEVLADKKLQKYYEQSYALCGKCYEEYMYNYELIPIERYAELRSDIITYDTLSYIYDIDKLKDIKKCEISDLLRGYCVDYFEDGTVKILSPLFRFDYLADYEKLKGSELDLSNYKTLYDRMYLGLDISLDEYNKMVDLFYDETQTNEKTFKLVNKL